MRSIVRANVLTLFNGIILACFLVLFAIGRWQDALFGFSTIANAVIGSVQEYRAKRALDRLALLNAPTAIRVACPLVARRVQESRGYRVWRE